MHSTEFQINTVQPLLYSDARENLRPARAARCARRVHSQRAQQSRIAAAYGGAFGAQHVDPPGARRTWAWRRMRWRIACSIAANPFKLVELSSIYMVKSPARIIRKT